MHVRESFFELPNKAEHKPSYKQAVIHIFMAALWNRAGHYIFALWILLLYFFRSFYLSFLFLA